MIAWRFGTGGSALVSINIVALCWAQQHKSVTV